MCPANPIVHKLRHAGYKYKLNGENLKIHKDRSFSKIWSKLSSLVWSFCSNTSLSSSNITIFRIDCWILINPNVQGLRQINEFQSYPLIKNEKRNNNQKNCIRNQKNLGRNLGNFYSPTCVRDVMHNACGLIYGCAQEEISDQAKKKWKKMMYFKFIFLFLRKR